MDAPLIELSSNRAHAGEPLGSQVIHDSPDVLGGRSAFAFLSSLGRKERGRYSTIQRSSKVHLLRPLRNDLGRYRFGNGLAIGSESLELLTGS
jgi:hypothetical protein